jgi:hypothetical protein
VTCFAAASVLGACSFDDRGSSPSNPRGNQGTGANPLPPIGAGGRIISGFDASVSNDANCGVVTTNLQRLPPDILIALDRSGSMRQLPDGTRGDDGMGMTSCHTDPACTSKWEEMAPAIQEVVTQTSMEVNWGLKFFGSGGGGNNNSCNVTNTVEVAIAPDNATAVNAAIAGVMTPDTGTPTARVMDVSATYMGGLTTPNPKFILLATDGQPTCRNNSAMNADDAAAITAVTNAAMDGVPTFVVGISTANNMMANQTLSAMANAGTRPRMGDPTYYPVNNRAELVTALRAIATAAGSCTMPLSGVPPDPNNVGVRVNGDMRVPQSTTDGWSYGAGMRSIILNGSYCTAVMNGTYTDIRALFGCPGIQID